LSGVTDACLANRGVDEIEQSSFDANSSSTIKLNNGTVLYLREVNRFLALVCILREDNFDKQGLIDYNFNCFREAIQEMFETSRVVSNQSVNRSATSFNGVNALKIN
jgi:Ras-related GTP-binding protein C/D